MVIFQSLLFVSLIAGIFSADIPTQVHVALAGSDSDGNSNKFAVSWNTKGSTPTSVLKYGKSSGSYSSSTQGTSASYYETYNHNVVSDVVEPDTLYYYVVGDEENGWSEELTFRSAPLSSKLRNDFSFFVFGDLGVVNGDPTNEYIKKNKENVKLVWHSGDVSYADDSFLHKGCVFDFCYEDTYDEYMRNVQPWASQIPYMVLPGNHEAGTFQGYIYYRDILSI